MILVGKKFLENVHVSLIEAIIAPSGYDFLPIGNSQSHEKYVKLSMQSMSYEANLKIISLMLQLNGTRIKPHILIYAHVTCLCMTID